MSQKSDSDKDDKKKKEEQDEKHESKKPPQKRRIKLEEKTALKSLNNKKGKDTLEIHVKRRIIDYEQELQMLQIELLKMQTHVRKNGMRVLLIFEGRDAAGKGGTIKRVIEHLNPRGARVVALEKPSDRERTQWYFQRYVAHLPAAGEIVFFDRSWYNRAMVEPVMGFCTDRENKRFLKDVPLFERMLVKDGIKLFKFYFSVSRKEQKDRFESRETDPLKQYKISPVDRLAQELWDNYTIRKFQMLTESNRTVAPWTIIRSNDKKGARLNCIKFVLNSMEYDGKIDAEHLTLDPEIVVSGIDELKHMEDNMMDIRQLPG